MSSLFVASFLLVSTVTANVLPRSITSTSTLVIPLPTQAEPFTTTVAGCAETVGPFVIIGEPTSTVEFYPGTITVYLPPQAEPTTTTIIDTVANETRVVIATTLPGECAEYPFPEPPSPTGPESPTPTPEVCPAKGCSGQLVAGATLVINAINKVSLISQNLQAPAKLIGVKETQGDHEVQATFAQGPIQDVARGLNSVAVTLTAAAPRIIFLPPFPPGCDTDTVVISYIEFVRIHQALLNILIGQAGLLENGPVKRDDAWAGAVQVYERDENAFVGRAIAVSLRAIERIVDTIAFKLISLVPTRGECAKQENAKLSASLKESITSYDK
jgi:hypothetical protein